MHLSRTSQFHPFIFLPQKTKHTLHIKCPQHSSSQQVKQQDRGDLGGDDNTKEERAKQRNNAHSSLSFIPLLSPSIPPSPTAQILMSQKPQVLPHFPSSTPTTPPSPMKLIPHLNPSSSIDLL